MQARVDFYKASPDAMKALVALEAAMMKLDIDPQLADLVKLRASLINGCAYCVDLHAADLRKKGASERYVHAVAVWREAPFFSDKERAALAWTESVTRVEQTHVPDADYEAACKEFSGPELVNLTVAIGLINLWNRLSVSFRKLPVA